MIGGFARGALLAAVNRAMERERRHAEVLLRHGVGLGGRAMQPLAPLTLKIKAAKGSPPAIGIDSGLMLRLLRRRESFPVVVTGGPNSVGVSVLVHPQLFERLQLFEGGTRQLVTQRMANYMARRHGARMRVGSIKTQRPRPFFNPRYTDMLDDAAARTMAALLKANRWR